ncbi:hypothetical protein OsI_02594 [Oryza sativa Indica Group]|uniref:Uncharacterized protein n=1 Tax=Oryza sativa subsp. indica TaxID=39946 RepID=B8AAS4_ORYSI|nr:hypothetical protein OsI_02594 [Oryza sativa Indica Group]
MATPSYAAVKCLNTSSSSRKRFVFKSFSQRVEEIDIDVYRSLHEVKAEPSSGSSFFLDALVEWRELNTADDFISFYEETIHLVQTLPQIVLHCEKIFSGLLKRINMKARLSLEPILMLVAALSRDILEDFLPFLGRHANAILALLSDGGDRDPEIMEQVFTSWSYVMMYLQKYLVKDVVQVLRITAPLRFFPKDYVREFMAESVSFVLRNAPNGQQIEGVRNVLLEAAKNPSPVHIDGITALLCHVMRGTYTRLHSRAGKIMEFLLSKSNLTTIQEKFPDDKANILKLVKSLVIILGNLSFISPFYDPVFKLTDLSMLVFVRKLLTKGPKIIQTFESQILRAASLGMTGECDPQNLLDLFSIFAVNLSSPNKDLRVLTLRILSYFGKMDQRLGTDEERPHKRQKTEDSGDDTIDMKYANVLDTLLAVESTPISVSTSRKIAIFVSRIQMSLSSKMVHEDYIPLLLHGIIGILYNRFSDLWPPALDCLAVLISKHKELVWDQFIQFIATHQSNGPSVKNQDKLEATIQPQSIFDCFSIYLSTNYDCTPLETVATLLLQSLQKISDVAESRSRHLVPLFLTFMGYDNSNITSVDSYISNKCKGKQWKTILKEWLNVLRLMRNARSLYQSKILQEVLTKRVLDESDPDIQSKALDCLLNWKDEFLTPYSKSLKNLIDSKTLREELTTWAVSYDSLSIQKDHRSSVVPLVIRVLTPKLKKFKLLGSRKHTGVSHRKAILRFLMQFDSNELQLFFSLLLKSLIPGNLRLEIFGSQSDNLLGNISDIVEASTEICLENLTWKKANGFLHLVEEIFGTFGMAHISPVLDVLLLIVVRLLESCMRNLRSMNEEDYPSKQSNDPDDECSMTLEAGNSMSLKEHSKDLPSADHNKESVSIKQLKDLRSLCIRIVSLALNQYGSNDFGEKFWNIFFTSVKPLIDCFRQEASSSEKPSSLFSCFMAMSQSPKLASLLGAHNLVPAIFSILTVKKASGSITSYALEFIENLIKLDTDLEQHGDHSLKKILVPHMDVLLHSLNDFVSYRRELHRKSGTWLGQRELRLFKLLMKYITDPSSAEHVLDLILPFFSKKDLNPDECLEALRVVGGILANLRCGVSAKILNALNPLLATAGLELRLCICDIYVGLSFHEPSVSTLAMLVRDLNAVSTSELGEVDYDTRIKAYDTIQPQSFLDMREEHVGAILSHCVYDMSSEELIFRQSASRALQSFLDFSASIMNNESKHCIETENNSNGIWTKGSIHQILEKTYLHNMGVAMSKDISIQKEWIILLREMVYNFNHVPSLNSFIPLCKEDLEEDFFHNITHLQAGKRSKALSLFKQRIKDTEFSEDVTMKVFVPLFFNMFFDVKAGKGEQVRDVCLDTLSSIAAKVQWEHYRTILMRCFRELSLKPDKQKIILRLICAVLDSFHFMKPAHDVSRNSDAMNEDSDSSLTFSSTIVSSEKQHYLQKIVFPQVQKLLGADPEKVNAMLVRDLNAVSTSELGEVDYDTRIKAYDTIQPQSFLDMREEHVGAILSHCVYDMSSEELIFRQSASRALQSFLDFSASIMNNESKHCIETENNSNGIWTKGSIHQILEKTYLHNMGVAMSKDISIQKEWIILLREMVYNFNHVPSLNSFIPLCKEDLEEDFFHNITHLQAGKRSKALSLFKQRIKDTEFSEDVTMKVFVPLFFNMFFDVKAGKGEQVRDVCLDTLSSIAAKVQWEHYRTILMRCFRELSLKPDKQKIILRLICAVLDSFHFMKPAHDVSRNSDAMNEDSDSSLTFSSTIVSSEKQHYLQKIVFPQVQKLLGADPEKVNDNANLIKNVLMDIAQRAGNSNGHLVTSCLKLLADLLRGFRISLSDDQLQIIVHFPIFVDLQTNPSPVALSLLKAIVKRKLVSPEIYDIVVRIGELMVTTQTESIRQQCIQILLQFFLNYPLSEKRLQQHIDFFLTNLSYEHPSGREAVLEMLHDILTRFPQRIVDDQGQTFFLHLVVALSNEQHQNVSSMILRAIQKLLGRIGDQGKNSIFEYTLSWYTGEKQNLWSASAQVIGLLVGDRSLGIGKHLNNILANAKQIMECSVIASGGQVDLADETCLPFWKESYHSIAMMERLLARFPELYFKQNMEEIWMIVCKLLIHPHSMLRNISSSLVASYFSFVEKSKREKKFDGKSSLLIQPSMLFLIAVSLMKQLRAEFWSSLSSSDHSAFLEGFELFGSTKAKNAFLLCTSASTDVNGSNLDGGEELTSLLVSSLLKRMGKIAMQMQDTQSCTFTKHVQMKIVFNCFSMISSALGAEVSLSYANLFLGSLYKVCEGFAGKVISDDVKQLADSVRDKLCDLIGTEKFVEVYNSVRKGLKQKRESRKQSEKLIAAVDPARHAKRKLRIAAKHREHKRRKIMTMKMGRWLR